MAEQALGPVGKTIVEVQLVLSQTGFCAAYIIFIYSTLKYILPLSEATIVFVVMPFQVRSGRASRCGTTYLFCETGDERPEIDAQIRS